VLNCVKQRPSKSAQALGTFTQEQVGQPRSFQVHVSNPCLEQLRDFFVFGKKPKAMDDETAALLKVCPVPSAFANLSLFLFFLKKKIKKKKHLAAYTIMEGDNQLFGVWPSPATPSPSSSRQANQAQGL